MSLSLSQPGNTLRERFFALNSPRDVADLLEIEYSKLIYHVYRVPPSKRYTTFTIPKKSGSTRQITAPISPLKILQRKLLQVLVNVYQPKGTTHGFVIGKSIVTNAKVHAGRKFVLNLDLEDFFPSINFGRVYGMFRGIPYQRNASVASMLAAICCFENQLPQGAPTSPIIANMICAKLDSQLRRLAQKYRCSYTRYGDDITFSTNQIVFPDALAAEVSDESGRTILIGRELNEIIHTNGFRVNTGKVRLQKTSDRQEVTGLTTNRVPNVRRRFVRQLRAMIHAWGKFGPTAAEQEFHKKYCKKFRHSKKALPSYFDVIRGKLEFLGMVRGKNNAMYLKFRRQLRSLAPERIKAIAQESGLDHILDSLWILESENDSKQGTAFALDGVGLVTCAHVVRTDTVAFRPDAITKKYPVKKVAVNEALDLAILEIGEIRGSRLVRESSVEPLLHDETIVAGFPNYRIGDTGTIRPGLIVGFRSWRGMRKMLIDAAIVAGNSGGPVLNKDNRVIGIAVTGADREETASTTEDHGVIPITALDLLLSSSG